MIAYCRIGERSSHTWFVLTHLLGYPNVRNYDGSWTEWGSLVASRSRKRRLDHGPIRDTSSILLDHYQNPRNKGRMEDADVHSAAATRAAAT